MATSNRTKGRKYSIRQVPLNGYDTAGERILVDAVVKNGSVKARYVYPCESNDGDRQIVFSDRKAAENAVQNLNAMDFSHYATVAYATPYMPSRKAPRALTA